MMFATPQHPGGGVNDPTVAKLDRDFQFYVAHAKGLIENVVGDSERQLCIMWLTKLCESVEDDVTVKKNRDVYLTHLLNCMAKNNLKGVFLMPPPHGPLPGHQKAFTGVQKFRERGQPPDWIEEVIQGDPKKQISKHISRDGRTYLATKILPDGGAYGYLAVSTDESGWFRPRPPASLFHKIPKGKTMSQIRRRKQPRSQWTAASEERRRKAREAEAKEAAEFGAKVMKRRKGRRRPINRQWLDRPDHKLYHIHRSPESYDAILLAGGRIGRPHVTAAVETLLEARRDSEEVREIVFKYQELLDTVTRELETPSGRLDRLLSKLEQRLRDKPHMAPTLALPPDRRQVELLKIMKNRLTLKIGRFERQQQVLKRLAELTQPYDPEAEVQVPRPEDPGFDLTAAMTMIGITPENLEKLKQAYTNAQVMNCQEVMREEKRKIMQKYNSAYEQFIEEKRAEANAQIKRVADAVVLESDMYRSWKNLSELIQRKQIESEKITQEAAINDLPPELQENFRQKLEATKNIKKEMKRQARRRVKLDNKIDEELEKRDRLEKEAEKFERSAAIERQKLQYELDKARADLAREEEYLRTLCEDWDVMQYARQIPSWYKMKPGEEQTSQTFY